MRCARPEPTSTASWESLWSGMESAVHWFGASLRRVSGRSPRNEGSEAEKGSEVYREMPG